jgi:hypothetical protein
MWGISLQAAQIFISQGLCSMELTDRTIQYVNHYVLTTEFFMNIKSDEQSFFKCTENNQPNALNLIFLFIPYNGSYMFRQLYAIIREHLSTF